eukprot:1161438-Pelagomonas_calceolata.AAC.4
MIIEILRQKVRHQIIRAHATILAGCSFPKNHSPEHLKGEPLVKDVLLLGPRQGGVCQWLLCPALIAMVGSFTCQMQLHHLTQACAWEGLAGLRCPCIPCTSGQMASLWQLLSNDNAKPLLVLFELGRLPELCKRLLWLVPYA